MADQEIDPLVRMSCVACRRGEPTDDLEDLALPGRAADFLRLDDDPVSDLCCHGGTSSAVRFRHRAAGDGGPPQRPVDPRTGGPRSATRPVLRFPAASGSLRAPADPARLLAYSK
jgi:hypothetical protein